MNYEEQGRMNDAKNAKLDGLENDVRQLKLQLLKVNAQLEECREEVRLVNKLSQPLG